MSKAKGEDADYKCTLSPEALKKAMEELNEVPENRLIEVQFLRDRLKKVPGLKARTDTMFLLAFLRGCCFDQEKTFVQVKNFYEIMRDRPDLFQDLKPSRVRHVLDSKAFDILKERDNEGRKIVVFRIKLWDPDSVSLIDCLKVYTLFTLSLIKDEDTQVFGIRVIQDCDGMSMKQVGSITPSMSKLAMNLAFYSFPLHIRSCDYIHENKLFPVFFAIFSPFLDSDVMKRIHFHGQNVETLLATASPEHIPSDFGGTEEPFTNQEWFDEHLSCDKWYEENNKLYGFLNLTLEDKKKEKKNENAGTTGMGGSFKKREM